VRQLESLGVGVLLVLGCWGVWVGGGGDDDSWSLVGLGLGLGLGGSPVAIAPRTAEASDGSWAVASAM